MEAKIYLGAALVESNIFSSALQANKKLLFQNGTLGADKILRKELIRQAKNFDRNDEEPERFSAILRDLDCDLVKIRRIVIIGSAFLARAPQVFQGTKFYPNAERLLNAYAKIFLEERVHLFFAIENPATYFPRIIDSLSDKNNKNVGAHLQPFFCSWVDLILRFRSAWPKARITIWRVEDVEKIMPSIIDDMIGISPEIQLKNALSFYSDLLGSDGAKKLQIYARKMPQKDDREYSLVFNVFRKRYGREKIKPKIEEKYFDKKNIDILYEIYEQDVDILSGLNDVTLIEPNH